jgi:aminomethyltransferase
MSASDSAITDLPLKTTPLDTLHRELGAKMVPFAGYSMPVQYPLGVLKEHLHTREKAGLFDVSHMGQVIVSGDDVVASMEQLIPIDIEALGINSQRYGVLPNEQGGLLDDLIVTRWAEDTLFIVVNAGCKEQDLAHFKAQCPQLNFNLLQDQALLALQGPAAVDIMAELAPAVCELTFMHGLRVSMDGADCYITRSGYTGEDGFEISVPATQAEALARKLLSFEQVEAIGLGARDSLRLEAGLCLYGHDMDEQTSPIEAGLLWSISKSRREGGEKVGGFTGAEKIFQHIRDGVPQKRVGLKITGRAPVREGAELVNESGKVVGRVTSGGFGPSFNAPLAMGYVNEPLFALGSQLFARVRKKQIPVEVVKTPFVAQRYYRG